MSRPRLIKTEKFLVCRDRDQSRLGNIRDVETETSRDWAKDVDTETTSRLSLISDLGQILLINNYLRHFLTAKTTGTSKMFKTFKFE